MNGNLPPIMSTLSLSLFDDARDAEATRYRVLAGLASARSAFTDCRVAPHLSDLVALHRGLSALVSGADAVARPGAVVDVDWQAGRLVRERVPAPLAVGLARWALPHVEAAIVEGRTVYEFAAEHAALEAVGVVPSYRDEGFLLIRDDAAVHVLRYRISPLAEADGRYRALRTTRLDTALDPLASPHVWKATLVKEAPDLAAPAAFCLQAEIDLPVEETLVPVAKRKLLGLVQSWARRKGRGNQAEPGPGSTALAVVLRKGWRRRR